MKNFMFAALAFALSTTSINGALAQKDKHDDHGHAKKSEKKGHDHGHAHEAPHGGTLVVVGEEYAHVEFVLDAADGKLSAFVLDGHAENAVRIKNRSLSLAVELVGKDKKTSTTEVELKALGNDLTGEKEGDTSEFEGKSDALKGAKKFEATLKEVEVRGKAFKNVRFRFPEGNE